MGKFIVLLALLLGSSLSFANGDCRFSQVYKSYSKDYILYNVVSRATEQLAQLTLSELGNQSKLEAAFKEALENTLVACGQKSSFFYRLDEVSSFQKQNQTILVTIDKKQYHLVRAENGVMVQWNLMRNYQGSFYAFLRSVYFSGEHSWSSVMGRDGKEESVSFYSFFYDSAYDLEEKLKAPIDIKHRKTYLKSFADIYPKSPHLQQTVTPKVKVGIIGSGLDLNHPGMARHIAFRDQIDSQIVENQMQFKNLTTGFYFHKSQYITDIQAMFKADEETGMPRWMDQALGSKHPFDQIIADIPIPSQSHETKMASRIISGGGDILLYSVRKKYGFSDSEDIRGVFKNFDRHGVQVVNMSFAYSCGKKDVYEDQWRDVFAKYPNMIMVVAAGNDGKDVDKEEYCPSRYSKDYPNVISVTALGDEGNIASYHGKSVNYGAFNVDVAVKADNLKVYEAYSHQAKMSIMAQGGSSIAAAEVSRIITEALLANLSVNPATIKSDLKAASATRAGLKGKVSSGGELNQGLLIFNLRHK